MADKSVRTRSRRRLASESRHRGSGAAARCWRLTHPALNADDLTAASRVYGYEFDDPNAPDYLPIKVSFPLGSDHGAELPYVFGRIPGPLRRYR
jgi:hypothetical protein